MSRKKDMNMNIDENRTCPLTISAGSWDVFIKTNNSMNI